MEASMKKYLIGLCLISSLSITAYAQNGNNQGQATPNCNGYALQNLNLSVNQQQQINALREQARSSNMTYEQRQNLRTAHQEYIKSILTTEQREIYISQINNTGRGMGRGGARHHRW